MIMSVTTGDELFKMSITSVMPIKYQLKMSVTSVGEGRAGLPTTQVPDGVQKILNGVHLRYNTVPNGVHL